MTLNSMIIGEIFELIKEECTSSLERLRDANDLPAECTEFVERMRLVPGLWTAHTSSKVLAANERISRPVSTAQTHCKACILARIGGDCNILHDLRVAIKARRRRGQGRSQLLPIVEAWIQHMPHNDVIIKDSNALSRTLLQYRKDSQENRRRARKRVKGCPNASSTERMAERGDDLFLHVATTQALNRQCWIDGKIQVHDVRERRQFYAPRCESFICMREGFEIPPLDATDGDSTRSNTRSTTKPSLTKQMLSEWVCDEVNEEPTVSRGRRSTTDNILPTIIARRSVDQREQAEKLLGNRCSSIVASHVDYGVDHGVTENMLQRRDSSCCPTEIKFVLDDLASQVSAMEVDDRCPNSQDQCLRACVHRRSNSDDQAARLYLAIPAGKDRNSKHISLAPSSVYSSTHSPLVERRTTTTTTHPLQSKDTCDLQTCRKFGHLATCCRLEQDVSSPRLARNIRTAHAFELPSTVYEPSEARPVRVAEPRSSFWENRPPLVTTAMIPITPAEHSSEHAKSAPATDDIVSTMPVSPAGHDHTSRHHGQNENENENENECENDSGIDMAMDLGSDIDVRIGAGLVYLDEHGQGRAGAREDDFAISLRSQATPLLPIAQEFMMLKGRQGRR